MVATVDREGRPHTAPFGSLWVASPNRLLFGCDRAHDTFANVIRDGRVAVCVIAPPDVAVTIFGRAAVLREAMDALPSDAVIEIVVDDVKNDMLEGAAIDAGVSYSVPDGARELIERYMLEIRRAGVSWPRDDTKLERVRALMAEHELDALVVRAPDNVLYLTNFWGMKGYDACVFPREGDPVLICLEASEEDAARMAWTSDVRLFKGYDPIDPRPPTARVLELAREAASEFGRVGLELSLGTQASGSHGR